MILIKFGQYINEMMVDAVEILRIFDGQVFL